MAKINWTFQALEDLNDIGEYLSQNSETYTKCIIDLLWEKAHLLENYSLPYTFSYGKFFENLKERRMRLLIKKIKPRRPI